MILLYIHHINIYNILYVGTMYDYDRLFFVLIFVVMTVFILKYNIIISIWRIKGVISPLFFHSEIASRGGHLTARKEMRR